VVRSSSGLCREIDSTPDLLGRYLKGMRWHNPGPVRRPLGFIEPCLPTNSRSVPIGREWAHEIKHDGFRFICRRDGKQVRVFSRRGHDWTDRVPRIVEALKDLRVKSVTIDGEGVVCRPDGVSDFDLLRAAVGRLGSRDAFLYVFDVLEINGTDLRPDAWEERRKVLVRLLRTANADGVRLSEHLDGEGALAFHHACRMGLEGIVAKRRDRPYRSGRSPDWVKIKNPDAPAVTRLLEE
jgi:bifunctional non-homologous end joining protein LigD